MPTTTPARTVARAAVRLARANAADDTVTMHQITANTPAEELTAGLLPLLEYLVGEDDLERRCAALEATYAALEEADGRRT